MSDATKVWLRCVVRRTTAERRLVCFPHAGGSASFFRGWGQHLANTEVHAVCYPGRAERLLEPPPEEVVDLAREIAAAVRPLTDLPVALFGHSMGAPVALEVARALEVSGAQVAHLFASGSRNGPLPEPELAGSDEDEDALFRKLARVGGIDSDLLEDEEFRELVLPYLLGDGRMFRRYVMSELPPINCAVTTIVGGDDDDADRRPWDRLTNGGFRETIVPGDHFYLTCRPPYDLLNMPWDGRLSEEGKACD